MRRFRRGMPAAVVLAALAACAPQPPFEEVTDPFANPLPPAPAVETGPITSNAAPGPSAPVAPGPIAPAPVRTEGPIGDPTEGASDTVTILNDGGLVERLPNTCRLEDYQQFQGQPGSAALSGVIDRPVRVIAPADIVTQEYNPQRVNFYTNGSGVVQRIICG